MIACTLLGIALTAGCNDGIRVQQAYDFSISTWHLPDEALVAEAVEIRFTLHRQGDFRGAEYRIGYIQLTGRGEVFDTEGGHLIDREPVPLTTVAGLDTSDPCAQRFTLFLRCPGGDKCQVRFFMIDNFGCERSIDVSLDVKDT